MTRISILPSVCWEFFRLKGSPTGTHTRTHMCIHPHSILLRVSRSGKKAHQSKGAFANSEFYTVTINYTHWAVLYFLL